MRLAACVLISMLVLPATAWSQVRRCVMPGGATVFTDRRCDTIGAEERSPRPSGGAAARAARNACPRTLRDLAYEVASSIEAHDVNRLAGVYLWSGFGTRDGYALMDRLQAIVDRPLVDLQPIYADADPDAPYPTTAPTRPPVGLRLEQTSIRGGTALRAVFGLRRHLDCWWIVQGGGARTAPRPAPAADAAPPVD